MRIGLISEAFIDKDLDFNFAQMTRWLRKSEGKAYDLLCFGESFAHGFDGLSWNYEEDLKIALHKDDQRICQLAQTARECKTGIAFGYIERDGQNLYSSYLVLSAEGKQLCNFRRLSPGWKEPIANPVTYLEGKTYDTFQLKDKTFGIAICGDLWHDDLLENFQQQKSDLLLWPLYINYNPHEWEVQEKAAYAERAGMLKRPVLMINSLSAPPNQSFGGAYLFDEGIIKAELAMGDSGILTIDF